MIMAEIVVKSGAIVWLKSGGPKMTVKLKIAGGWLCSWFVGTDLKEGVFSAEQLTQEDPDSGPSPKAAVTFR